MFSCKEQATLASMMEVLIYTDKRVCSVADRTKISPLILPGVKYVSSMVAAYPVLEPLRNVYEKLGFGLVCEGKIPLSVFLP